MKTTNHFKRTIQAYLEETAIKDELFAVAYAKTGKNIDECITYILNEVQKSVAMGLWMKKYMESLSITTWKIILKSGRQKTVK